MLAVTACVTAPEGWLSPVSAAREAAAAQNSTKPCFRRKRILLLLYSPARAGGGGPQSAGSGLLVKNGHGKGRRVGNTIECRSGRSNREADQQGFPGARRHPVG